MRWRHEPRRPRRRSGKHNRRSHDETQVSRHPQCAFVAMLQLAPPMRPPSPARILRLIGARVTPLTHR
jgi:hypothetical protein